MTEIQRQVRTAQFRLWANGFLGWTCWCLTAAAGAMAAVVTFDRLYGLGWPLGWIAPGLATAGVAAALIGSYLRRADAPGAAAALDQAAGLRERISTGLYCEQAAAVQGDEFAHAVVADAQRVGHSLSVRQHLRLRLPFAGVYAVLAAIVPALLLLLPSGLLVEDPLKNSNGESEDVTRAKVVVQRRLEEVKKLSQVNPALKELSQDLEKLDQPPEGKLDTPQQVRNEAIKKIDRMADSLREQRQDEKFGQVDQLQKMLRTIQPPSGENRTAVDKLTKALASGDLKAASEQIKAAQEELAKMKLPEDAAKIQQMQQQLESLSKKLEAVAENQQLKEKLEQAGVKKEDIERMLQTLDKKDLDQLKEQLQKQGLSQKDIEKLAEQLQKQQQAGASCKQMSQALSQAASAAAQGQMGQAMSDLESAGETLSEAEMLEQEMNQLDSALADLQDAKNDLDNGCSQCNGTGQVSGRRCGQCRGTGNGRGGMGDKPGQGQGGLAQEEQTATGFKIERSKVETTRGRIVGQFLVDGQQVKGEVADELADTVAAEEREATDLIYRDRIPRQYQKSVKEYFSTLQRQLGRTPPENEKTGDSTEPASKARGDDASADSAVEEAPAEGRPGGGS